jgi:hypothetical protein
MKNINKIFILFVFIFILIGIVSLNNSCYAVLNENETLNNSMDKTSPVNISKKITKTNVSPLSKKSLGEMHAIWVRYDSLNKLNAPFLKKNGVTDVLVLTPRDNPSVLRGFINKCKPQGIRVHAWIICFKGLNDGKFRDPQNGVIEGQPIQTYLNNKIKSIALNYNIDGIHLDYVRYRGTAYEHVNSTQIITNFVSKVRNTLDRVGAFKGKYLYLSAAVMPETTNNTYLYGQSYEELSPHLDFMAPMVYKGSYKQSTAWIAKITSYIVKHSTTKVIAGLLTYKSDSKATPLSSNELKNDVTVAMKYGATGYCLFRFGLITPDFVPFMKISFKNYPKFTKTQIITTAIKTYNYMVKNRKLPSFTYIGTKKINMAQLLNLITICIINIAKNSDSTTLLTNYNLPTNSIENIKSGILTRKEYLNFAQRIIDHMNINQQAPSIGLIGLGQISFKSQIYLYCGILNIYKTQLKLPTIYSLQT